MVKSQPPRRRPVPTNNNSAAGHSDTSRPSRSSPMSLSGCSSISTRALDKALSEVKINLEQKDDQKIEEKPIQPAMLKQIEEQLQLAGLKIKENGKKLIQGQSRIKVYAEQVAELRAANTMLELKSTSNEEKLVEMKKELSRSSGVSEALKLDFEKKAKSMKDLRNRNLKIESSINQLDVHDSALVNMENRIKEQLDTTKNQIETLESSCRSLQAERKRKSTGSTV